MSTEETVEYLKKKGYILVGSRAFFTGMDNFNPHDYDFCKVVNKGEGFKYHSHMHFNGVCKNEIVKMPNDKYFDFILKQKGKMEVLNICCFFVPEIAKKLEFNFNRDYKKLEPFLDKFGKKYQYYRIIYNAYIENGKMRLTDEQRKLAYQSYLDSRR